MQALSTVSSVGVQVARYAITGFVISTVVESALSNVLGLQTLRDGTNFQAWCRIQWIGLDPKKAVKKEGCHIFSDTYNPPAENVYADNGHLNAFQRFANATARPKLLHSIVKRMGPWGHGVIRGAAAWEQTGPQCLRLPARVLGAFIGFFTPTITVHLTPTDAETLFRRVKGAEGHIRIHTRERENIVINPRYLGLVGVLVQGSKDGWSRVTERGAVGLWPRMKNDPGRVLFGVIQLSAIFWAIAVSTQTHSQISSRIVSAVGQHVSSCWIGRSALAAGVFAYLSR